jgi:predicted Fe-S protein YdhL (DUF1289 family)
MTKQSRLKCVREQVARKTLGCKRDEDEVTGDWRKLQTEKLHHLYTSLNIILAIKLKKKLDARSKRHVWGSGEVHTDF